MVALLAAAARMFAPSTSRPPYFTPHVRLVWSEDDSEQTTGVQRPRTAQSPPPFQTEPSTRPTASRKRRLSTRPLGKRTGKVIPTRPAPLLTAALSTHNFLHTLSTAVHDTPAPSQTILQALYNDLLTVASHSSTPPNVSSNGRHKHALLLRLIQSSVLWVEMQGKGKEELDLFDNCCSHLAGLLVLSVNGRAAQSDDSTAIRAKRTERPKGGKLTVAEELHAYRTAMLARALPHCLQNNVRTLYHISLVGVSTDWTALSALLPSLPFLHHLHVQQCDITDQAAGVLLSALSGSGVTHLSLSGNRLTDAVVHSLCRLILSQALRREDIEWQWRLRTSDQLPLQRSRLRSSDKNGKEVKNAAIREQGLLSVDMSGNCITDSGMLRLIDTLEDDCWLLTALLHDNVHSEKAVVAFFAMLSRNTTLLHYSIMPVAPAPLVPGFPPSSPRSRPTSPRGMMSVTSSSSSRSWSSVSSLSDPHFHLRAAGVTELHRRQLLLCPRLTLNDQSAARFGHGMRGQRDVKLAAAVESHRLLAAIETARAVPWENVVRQRQDEMRPAQRADGRPKSPVRPRSGRSLSPPAVRLRPTSAASILSDYSSSRPPSAAMKISSTDRGCPQTTGPVQQQSSSQTGSRSDAAIKPLPLALLDSLFKQLEAVDSAYPSPEPNSTHNNINAQQPAHGPSLPPLPSSALPPLQSQHSQRDLATERSEQQSHSALAVKEAEEQKEASGRQSNAAEWRELRQWANEQQSKVVPVNHADVGSAAKLVQVRVDQPDEIDTHAFVRPSAQVLSMSDLLDED